MLATGSFFVLLFLFFSPNTCEQKLTINSVANAAGSAGGSVSNYGNGVKDATKASGPRAQTAQNPLGMSSNSYGGKKVVAGSASKGGRAGDKGTAGNPLGL